MFRPLFMDEWSNGRVIGRWVQGCAARLTCSCSSILLLSHSLVLGATPDVRASSVAAGHGVRGVRERLLPGEKPRRASSASRPGAGAERSVAGGNGHAGEHARRVRLHGELSVPVVDRRCDIISLGLFLCTVLDMAL